MHSRRGFFFRLNSWKLGAFVRCRYHSDGFVLRGKAFQSEASNERESCGWLLGGPWSDSFRSKWWYLWVPNEVNRQKTGFLPRQTMTYTGDHFGTMPSSGMLGMARGGWFGPYYTILVGCRIRTESGWIFPSSQPVSLLCHFDLYGRVLKRFLTHKFSCSTIQLSKTY